MNTPPSSTGPLMDPDWLSTLEPVARFLTTNPFESAWIECEKAALGKYHDPKSPPSAPGTPGKNREQIAQRVAVPLVVTAERLARGITGTAAEILAYQGGIFYVLWQDFGPRLQRLIDEDAVDVPFYDELLEFHRTYVALPGYLSLTAPEPAHLLALLYKMQRTWHFARTKIRGASARSEAARAAIWRASQGVDFIVYATSLYRHMDQISVLITGETGTGKDLAATCLGWSRYIPFDPTTRRFTATYAADFHARNLCEVAPDLLDSALFGHKRGSFTGATADKAGFFALPKPHGTLFLDEVGELPGHAQVKLLRPLQNREYVPLGETVPRPIQGRTLFATHRDLEVMCRAETFRADLYERMNGVHIAMPTLREMLAESPDELRHYVRGFVADKLDGPEPIHGASQVETWTERVVSAIHATRSGYRWPHNLRELKNYTERYLLTEGREYEVAASPVVSAAAARKPETMRPRPAGGTGAPESTCMPSSGILGPRAKAGEVTFEELNRSFVTRMHVIGGQNKAETARLIGLDWRTVRRWLDPVRLARWVTGKA